MLKQIVLCMVAMVLMVSGNALAEDGEPEHEDWDMEHLHRPMPVEKIAPGVFRIGEVQIHKRARSITFPAQVNMDSGLLEYLLVQSRGKTHESLLRTDVDPYSLNIAFLLLGFEGTDRPLAEQGALEKPEGESVEITIIYHDGTSSKWVPAESWIVKHTADSEISVPLTWKYTGSMILAGAFQAQVHGSIAAIYHDPAALIDHASEGGESDEIWFVNEAEVPPLGTPVTVVFKEKTNK